MVPGFVTMEMQPLYSIKAVKGLPSVATPPFQRFATIPTRHFQAPVQQYGRRISLSWMRNSSISVLPLVGFANQH